jgi:hypothetical protein
MVARSPRDQAHLAHHQASDDRGANDDDEAQAGKATMAGAELLMRDLLSPEINCFRIELSEETLKTMGVTDPVLNTNGAFVIDYPSPPPLRSMERLLVIAASGGGWDHISVSLEHRCPTWAEMEHIAKLFFKDDEVAVQYHVPAKDHINNHPYVLHWWRPRSKLKRIPMPPKSYV